MDSLDKRELVQWQGSAFTVLIKKPHLKNQSCQSLGPGAHPRSISCPTLLSRQRPGQGDCRAAVGAAHPEDTQMPLFFIAGITAMWLWGCPGPCCPLLSCRTEEMWLCCCCLLTHLTYLHLWGMRERTSCSVLV